MLLLPLFLAAITSTQGLSQSNVVLESGYQLAWGGGTWSATAYSAGLDLVCKTFYWMGTKGVNYPISLYSGKDFRLEKIISDEKGATTMKIIMGGRQIVYPSGFSQKFVVHDLVTGKKIREAEAPFQAQGGWDVDETGRKLVVWHVLGSQKPVMIDLNTGKVLFEMEKHGQAIPKFVCNDSVLMVAGKTSIQVLNTSTGALISEWSIPDDFRTSNGGNLTVSNDTRHFLMDGYIKSKNSPATLYAAISPNGQVKVISFLLNNGFTKFKTFSHDDNHMYRIIGTQLEKIDLKTGRTIFSMTVMPPDTRTGMIFSKMPKELIDVALIRDGKYALVTDNCNVTYIVSLEEKRVVAYLYSLGYKDYAFVTPDGRMDGTKEAIDKLNWVVSDPENGDKRIPLSATYDQMYTPNLMAQIFSNTLEQNTVNLEDMVRYTPEISILSPGNDSRTPTPEVNLSCNVKAKGDDIDKVRIYVNDKLVTDETRGMKSVGMQMNFQVSVLPGVNTIKAVAITKKGYQSSPAEIKVTYDGASAESRLFVIAIGIDKYRNSIYNLNYAVADASAFAQMIRQSGKTIFKSASILSFLNEGALRDSILKGFSRIAAEAQPQDEFILFYAGHGVMSEGSAEVPKDFYLALQDVTQIYGRDDLLQAKGISAAELREFSKTIKAQKQVFFLDACQSGAAVETFAMRGAAEEKAILQLARSTGSCMIASTGSDQFATEFKELGHGVFTYAILQGMSCSVSGSGTEKKVTVKELETYLNEQIPLLTGKYRGSVQYPRSWSKGMDFPLGICQ
jgi:hypothetical protein